MRNTKIICTLGPSVDNEEALRELIRRGMNAARFNFSHGSHESQLATLRRLERARDAMGVPVATILDTKGPEIRVRDFEGGSAVLEAGSRFTLTAEAVTGSAQRVTVSYGNLAAELQPGNHVLLDDGLIELEVEACHDTQVDCRVITGGVLSNHKSINIPDAHIALPAVTPQDREDLLFAVKYGFDWVAASFIRCAADIAALRAVLDENGGGEIRIIAKIENREGLAHLEEILDAADAVMVARGDMGVEIPACQVPVVQKRMVIEAIQRGKPVIIATQMLDSMIRNPRPTRAEVSDVANAIFDGASCVMLSGETASGKYPFEALETMAEAVETAEASVDWWDKFRKTPHPDNDTINEAITHACCTTAMDLNARAILTMTRSGRTARMVARFRPGCPILALTTSRRVQRQLAISWGVEACLILEAANTDDLMDASVETALRRGAVCRGDTVVITAGIPLGSVCDTNLVKAQVV